MGSAGRGRDGRLVCPTGRGRGRAPPTRRPSNEKKALEERRGAAQNRTELRKLGYSEMKFAVGGELGLGLKSATSVGQREWGQVNAKISLALMPTRVMGVSEGEFCSRRKGGEAQINHEQGNRANRQRATTLLSSACPIGTDRHGEPLNRGTIIA